MTFEDGDGSQSIPTTDWTNYVNHGQLMNGAIIINNGKYNKCVYLPDDETDPHVRIDLDTDPDDVDYIVGVFTVDCWVKPNASLSGPSVIASQYNSWELGMDDDLRPYFKVKETGGNWITAKHPLPLIGDYNGETDHNSWHHVMGVFKTDQIYLFLDGKSGYRSGNIHSIRSFSGYTRQVSSAAIYLGVRWTGSVYEDQYYGSIDSFRLRKGVYDLNEDTDGDNMADKYEIIRSLHSDQFDPFVHNTRFATLLSGVNFKDQFVFEDRHFKIDAYDNYNTLKKLGYDDDDIVYLDNNNWYKYQDFALNWGLPHMYENGEWIDGEATKNNVRTMFSQLSVGGNLTLEYPDFTTRIYTVPKIESNDNYYWVSNCHGGEGSVNIPDPPYSEPQFHFWLSEQLLQYPNHNQVNYYETEFISDLSGLDFKYASIIVSACHSSLLHYGYYNVKADNRIIITPTDNPQGGTNLIPYLYWSSRISGNSSSYREWANQYCDPSNTIYNNDVDLLKLIKYHLNGDDMEEWSIAQQSPLDVDIIYKGYNTRNVCVSIQEAFMIADMWVNILNINNAQQGGSPMMSEGDDVPNQMMI